MSLAYLDNAAAAPLRPVARDALCAVWDRAGCAGMNPQAQHAPGRQAAFWLDDARARVAACLDADPAEVIFTSGATEGVVLALRGIVATRPGRDVIHTALDHPAVHVTAASCAKTRVIAVDATGALDLDAWERLRTGAEPAVVAATAVASETGVIVPVETLIADTRAQWGSSVPVVIDATQAIGRLPVSFAALGCDALVMAGHKIGAPAGTGVLCVRRDLALTPLLTGGGHERGLRAGTPDVAGAQALAAALEEACAQRVEETHRHEQLRADLIADLPAGVRVAAGAPAVPAITMLVAAGCSAEALLLAFDGAGVAVSAGSACHAGVARPSPALIAQGLSEAEALGSIRVSFGWASTREDVRAFRTTLPAALQAARALNGWRG